MKALSPPEPFNGFLTLVGEIKTSASHLKSSIAMRHSKKWPSALLIASSEMGTVRSKLLAWESGSHQALAWVSACASLAVGFDYLLILCCSILAVKKWKLSLLIPHNTHTVPFLTPLISDVKLPCQFYWRHHVCSRDVVFLYVDIMSCW